MTEPRPAREGTLAVMCCEYPVPSVRFPSLMACGKCAMCVSGENPRATSYHRNDSGLWWEQK